MILLIFIFREQNPRQSTSKNESNKKKKKDDKPKVNFA